MAIATRKFGWDVSVLSVDSVNVQAVFTGCKLAFSAETAFSRACNDTNVDGGVKYNVEKQRRWTLELGAVIEGASLLFEGARTAVGVLLPITLTGGGLAFTGHVVYQTSDLDQPDGASMEGATLIGAEPLAAA